MGRKKLIKVDWYKMFPVAVLEGAEFIAEQEEILIRSLHSRRMYPIVLEDLYEHPSRLVALKFLEPKTIVLSTTGVYREKLEECIAYFKIAEHIPDNVVLGLGEDALWGVMREFRKLKPSIRFFKLYTFGWDDPVELDEFEEVELPRPDWTFEEVSQMDPQVVELVFEEYNQNHRGEMSQEEWYSENTIKSSEIIIKFFKDKRNEQENEN